MQMTRLHSIGLLRRSVSFNGARSVHLSEDARTKALQDVPGPPGLPFVGPLRHFLPGGLFYNKSGMSLMSELFKRYGPIVKMDAMLGRPVMLFLFAPEAFAYVLRAENSMPIRPGFQSIEYFRKVHVKHKFKDMTGLITDHGEKWKKFRTLVNPVMLQPKAVRLYASALDEVALDMVHRLKSLRDENNMVTENLSNEMNKWALESIGIVALGGRIGALRQGLPRDSPAGQLIQCVHDIFEISEKIDFKPSLWRYYPTRSFKRAMKVYDLQLELSKQFISEAVRALAERRRSEHEKGILEKLLDIDEDVALIMATDMLFAGVDTAANTVLAALYLLATNPDKQDKLREEIFSKDEGKTYLKACIKESMRLMPVVSGNLRQTTKDMNILGYSIPKNTQLIFSHQFMSLQESEYPRAKEFIPERWLVEKEHPLYHGQANPFTMMPFGFGVRQCIGKRIADLEMETFVKRLLENFKVEWTGPPLNVKASSINYVTGPYNYIFKDL